MQPISRYARMAPPGPASEMVAPEATNKPVPMAPPSASMLM